ncbi:MAG: two pore domain potassium channel family protein [Thermoleophilia bacterium]|nr:two pore domain potassium channel family protein [Thermoleophilia bacterium]
MAETPESDPDGRGSGRLAQVRRFLAVDQERYGLALLLILASIIFIMVAGEGAWARVVAIALQGLAVVASLRAAESPRPFRHAVRLLVGAALCFSVIDAAATGDVNSRFVEAVTLTLILVATPAIAIGLIRQIRGKRGATLHSMLGVLCIYLLLSLAFAAGFGVLDAFNDGPMFTQGADWGTIRNYQYFSLTTITTFGIGDLTPASDTGRALTGAEALLGQIYLVTVVALMVSNLRPVRD